MAGIFIFVILLMRVLQSYYSKRAANILPDGISPYLGYITVTNLFSAGFALVLMLTQGAFSGWDLQAILLAACSGMSLAFGSICGIKALVSGTIVLNSIFSTAGMILPIFLSALLFDERITVLQYICMAVLFLALYLIVNAQKRDKNGFQLKTLWYLIGSFLSNGIVMFCQKLFGYYRPQGNVALFSMLTFLIPGLAMGAMLLVLSGKQKVKTPGLPKRLYLYAAILAFAVFLIQQFVTVLTPMMSALALFTVVNGGGTIIAAVVGAAVYKEKITVTSGLGILLGLAALILIQI